MELKEIVADLFRRKGTMNYPLGRCEDFVSSIIKDCQPKVSEQDIANFHNNLMTISDDSLNAEESHAREVDYIHQWLALKGIGIEAGVEVEK